MANDVVLVDSWDDDPNDVKLVDSWDDEPSIIDQAKEIASKGLPASNDLRNYLGDRVGGAANWLGDVIGAGGAGMIRSGLGLGQGLNNLVADPLTVRDTQDKLAQTKQELTPKMDSYLGDQLTQGAIGAMEFAPAMASGPLSPLVFGLQSFGNRYADTEQYAPSLASGAVGAAAGLIPGAFNKAIGPYITNAVTPYIAPLISNSLMMFGMGEGETAIDENILGQQISPEEKANRATNSLVQGLIFGGAHDIASAIKPAKPRVIPQDHQAAIAAERQASEVAKKQSDGIAEGGAVVPLGKILSAHDAYVKKHVPLVTDRTTSKAFDTSIETPELAPIARNNPRASSSAYGLEDVSPETVQLQMLLDRENAALEARQRQQRDEEYVSNSKIDQFRPYIEPVILGDKGEPVQSDIQIVNNEGGGARIADLQAQLAEALKGGTEVYKMNRGWLPKAPEERFQDPTIEGARGMLEAIQAEREASRQRSESRLRITSTTQSVEKPSTNWVKTVTDPVTGRNAPDRSLIQESQQRTEEAQDATSARFAQRIKEIADQTEAERSQTTIAQIAPTLDEKLSEKTFASPKEVIEKTPDPSLEEATSERTFESPAKTVQRLQQGKNRFPITYKAADEIAVRPDLMQFKQMDNRDKGTNKADELNGEYDELKGGTLLLWEPKNPSEYGLTGRQKYIVANGHHRYEFGQRVGHGEFNSQVLREADGYSAKDARRLAAEINIADGKGDLFDAVKFLRDGRGTSAEDASVGARARLGAKGRQASTIAYDAGPSLYDAFLGGVVTPAQAEGIARGAPGRDAVQRAGIKAVTDEKSIDPISLEMSVKGLAAGVADRSNAVQQDIFAIDDSSIQENNAIAKLIAEQKSAALRQQRAIGGAAAAPELANESGVVNVVDAQAAKAKVRELQARREALKHVQTNPEEMAKLRSAVRKKGSQKGLFDDSSGQGGFWDIQDAFDGITNALAKLKPEGGKKLEREFGAKIIDTPPMEKFFEGRIAGANLPGMSKIAATYRRGFVFPKTLAEKSQLFKPVFETALKLEDARDTIAFDLSHTLKDYTVLKDKSNANSYLAGARLEAQERGDFAETPEFLARRGLSPEDIKAVQAWRNTAEQSLNVVEQTLIKDGKAPAEAAEIVDALRGGKFVPFGRFGNRFVYSPLANHFSLHESETSVRSALADLKKAGYGDMRTGQFRKPPSEAYEDLPISLSSGIGELPVQSHNGALPPQGFRAHLTPAKLTAGFEKNFERSISEYVMSLSNWASRKQARPDFERALKGMEKERQDGTKFIPEAELYAYSKRYIDYMTKSTPEMQRLRNAMTVYYLGNVTKSAAVNLTQSITLTYHLMAKETGYAKATALYGSAMKNALWYMTSPKSFAKAHPDLNQVLDILHRRGRLSANNWRELTGRARGGVSGKSALDYSMFMFDAAEQLNRIHATIAGAEIAKAKGANIDEMASAGERLTNDSQFILGKANRPEVARGKTAPLFLFKQFQGNWFRTLRNNMTKKDWPYAAGMFGTMLALGGAAAIPLGSGLMKLLETSGNDPKRKIRKALPKWAGDSAIYGIPAAVTGMDLSGSLAVGELPDFSKGLIPGIANYVGGIPASMVQKGAKALWEYNTMEDPHRAAEAALPPGFGSMYLTGDRWDKEGVRSPYGEQLLEKGDLTPGEIWRKKYLGVQPLKVSKAYERQNSLAILDANARGKKVEIMQKLKNAIRLNKPQHLKDVINEAVKWNATASNEEKITDLQIDSLLEQAKLQNLKPGIAKLLKMPDNAKPAAMDIINSFRN